MTFDPELLGQPKQELAALLKELRKRAGLSGDRLAKRCDMSQSSISRIENGKTQPSLVDVERILRALGAPAEVVAEVTALARLAGTQWQDIRAMRRKGLDKKQAELAALESSSTELRYFLLSMITGLLSTPEYIQASLAHSPVDTREVVARKLARQEVLRNPAKRFTFILTEQAVRWPLVPPEALAAQIDRLEKLTHVPHIRIGVIPLGGYVPVAALDTFTIYDRTLATVENTMGVLILRDSRDIDAHLELFSQLETFALFGDDARERLSAWSAACGGGRPPASPSGSDGHR
ncbi:helix-turn-helix domain-containing protein [Streptomyces uncialis]|uniref:helix-turn-helix domain-containing protein n=1 Tax=Streptomyces uncialis TaxID=1048205 RepID=UPI0037F1F964